MITRRFACQAVAGLVAAGPAFAADRVVKVGLDLSFTGADATDAIRTANGGILAFEEANSGQELPGFTFQLQKYDDGSATAGQYDPAQAATNARRMVSDRAIVAALGPQMSGAAKAMAPILSTGNLAIVTPVATNPDLTDPKFAALYRPGGRAVFFRTVATDAYQGPNMANYLAQTLKVHSVYVLDDSGAYGVGLADAFQRQAGRIGIRLLGRDRLDPKAADYAAVLTKIKSLDPQALYYGGVAQAAVKLAKQAYEIIPTVIKAGGDGVQSADLLAGAGFPAVEGWYATIAAAHVTGDPKLAAFSQRYVERFSLQPDDYAVTCYVGARVIIQAAKDLLAQHREITRDAMRDAIQDVQLPDSLLGPIAFDANGDLRNQVISVFQIRKDPSRPLDSPNDQYQYVGVAPAA